MLPPKMIGVEVVGNEELNLEGQIACLKRIYPYVCMYPYNKHPLIRGQVNYQRVLLVMGRNLFKYQKRR